MEVLLDISQDFGDELINGPVGSIPQEAPSKAAWLDFGDDPLVMTKTERAQSFGSAMSAMMAVLKLYYMRQVTYSSAMLALHQAHTAQCRLQRRVRRLRRAARDAQTHIANAMMALEACRNKFVNAIRESDEA
jgi:hypothetical protein